VFFGKLFFAVAQFLNNFQLLADLTISGIRLICEVCSDAEACHGKSITAEMQNQAKSTRDIYCSMNNRYSPSKVTKLRSNSGMLSCEDSPGDLDGYWLAI